MHAHSSPLVVGHRGASGYRPEHTRAAYELAFALGADAVEPDLVATRDGVLVLRHENEISGTTDVAAHPEFADRRATKEIDGVEITGWFTEDFTWAELSGLRATERVPSLRQTSASFDGRYPILRFRDLVDIVDRASDDAARLLGIVAELKHATYFESIGLPLDDLFDRELAETGWGDNPELIVESFERTVLAKLYQRGYRGRRFYLVESTGAPADRVAALGSGAAGYDQDITAVGLYALGAADAANRVDGISVDHSLVLTAEELDLGGDPTSELVDTAHSAGLRVFCWTLRPENHFLPQTFRRGESDSAWGDWRTDFSLIMRSGVDGVFADQPDLAVAIRDGS
ncbi:glycerophosphodiester phosphodiesterase [Diaminobutyricibacter tongyongensis]|uniref:glycerophosphodiester phosphodiesterase n=1 Tax=Leifsonia tongyongensis TaxID=1268043 RepID=A0A6L9XTU9_9MICO|nr:glycerophosphodiester phosphodiesterase family protein [Diaminobutyricibacter tongyongensis]NEN04428.1 glycerophosphodiester phosphodiesterase [Diaminobutyricibacter tongyongensis]